MPLGDIPCASTQEGQKGGLTQGLHVLPSPAAITLSHYGPLLMQPARSGLGETALMGKQQARCGPSAGWAPDPRFVLFCLLEGKGLILSFLVLTTRLLCVCRDGLSATD